MSARTLYLAFDEAGNGQNVKGEVIACVASLNSSDVRIGIFERNKRSKDAFNSLNASSSAYYFTIIRNRVTKPLSCNISLAAPYLVTACLSSTRLPSRDWVRDLHIVIDGAVSSKEQSFLSHKLKKDIEQIDTVTINTYSKNGHRFTSRRVKPFVRCPWLLYQADIRASSLYRMQNLLEEEGHTRRVVIEDNDLQEQRGALVEYLWRYSEGLASRSSR